MKEVLRISRIENEMIKKFSKLKKKKYRDELRLFLAEGRKFLDYPERAQYLLLREDIVLDEATMDAFSCPIFSLTEKCFQKMSSQENSQGVILVCSYKENPLEKMGEQILVLDNVQDPGNLGTILRLADAAGFRDILLTDKSVDVNNEKVVRSSMGSIFHVNIYTRKKEEIINFLQENHYHCIATSLEEDSIPYTEVVLKEKNAFIFGNEGSGISQEFLNVSSQKTIIPISGKAESLNVAMAVGILIFYLRDLKRVFK